MRWNNHSLALLKPRIDEISPLIDPATGGVRIKARIIDSLPDTALLGAVIKGRQMVTRSGMMLLPASALVAGSEGPALWVVDESNMQVALQPIDVKGYSAGFIVCPLR